MNNISQEVIVTAHKIDEVTEHYQYVVELIEVDKLLISVFNTQSGYTYKTYIQKDDDWYKENIYIFRGEFSNLQNILTGCLIKNQPNLNHDVVDKDDKLCLLIRYADTMFPFELTLDIPKFISVNGPLEDKVNSLEYQVKRLHDLVDSYKTINVESEPAPEPESTDEIYNTLGHLIYKGGLLHCKPHGKGVRYCDDSELIVYEGEFKNGLYDGHGTLNDYGGGSHCNGLAFGCYYVGEFTKGLKNGLVEYFTIYQSKPGFYKYSAQNYKHGLLHGSSMGYSEEGTTGTTTNYENGHKVQ